MSYRVDAAPQLNTDESSSAVDGARPLSQSQSDAEVARLWDRWRTTHDESVRNRLAEIYYPVVVLVARQMAQTLSDEIDFGDIEGYGAEGLLDAIERFDPARGVLFSTFARYRIHGAVYDRMREYDWVSRRDRMRERQLKQEREQFVLARHRNPTLAEEAELLSSTISSHEELVARLAASKMTSLAHQRNGENAGFEPPASDGGPLSACLAVESHDVLRQAIEHLDDRERQVIMLTYSGELSLADLAVQLGVTKSRVCQIRARALRTLRQFLTQNGVTGPFEPELV